MTTHTLPPIDYTGPLSKRAVQMMRDLKGLSILESGVPTLSDTVSMPRRGGSAFSDELGQASFASSAAGSSGRIEPTLGGASVVAHTAPFSKKNGSGGGGFSREAYLKEVRESLFGSVLSSLVVLMCVLGGLLVIGKEVLLPESAQIKQKQAALANLPLSLKTVEAQLALQQKKLESIVQQNNHLMNYFPDSQEIESTYVDFLNLLESQKVNVVGQSSSVTQSSVSPLYASFKASGDDKKQFASNAGKSKAVNLSGATTTGLNYYHVEIALQGSYVAYLSARQALVSANPNLVVHAESIQASASTPGQMDMVVFASLPFLSHP